jgi:hypothetical protein
MARDEVKQEPRWTESLAVGNAVFGQKIKPLILSWQETEIREIGKNIRALKQAELTGKKQARKPAPSLVFEMIFRASTCGSNDCPGDSWIEDRGSKRQKAE